MQARGGSRRRPCSSSSAVTSYTTGAALGGALGPDEVAPIPAASTSQDAWCHPGLAASACCVLLAVAGWACGWAAAVVAVLALATEALDAVSLRLTGADRRRLSRAVLCWTSNGSTAPAAAAAVMRWPRCMCGAVAAAAPRSRWPAAAASAGSRGSAVPLLPHTRSQARGGSSSRNSRLIEH